MPDSPVTVHLVDASPYIFRAFFSVPGSIVDPAGRPVNAVHGFAAFLLKLIAEERPSHLGLAFDGSLTTSFRNQIYPEYKAQRELPPADLEAQLDDCRELGAALGAATYIDRTYEADDLIGTLVRQLRERGHRAVVVSSDKDLTQLVDDGCRFYDFARGARYGVEGVAAKLGVRPGQVADLLALAGDSVDNIPGVRGVGPKSATALLAHFDSIEAIYDGLERIEALDIRGARSLREKLEAQRSAALLSKRLARIATDAPVRADLDELELAGASAERIDALFERLGFTSLRERIERWA